MRTAETQDWTEYVAYAMDGAAEVATKILCPGDEEAVMFGESMDGVHRVERDGLVIYPQCVLH
jgi:hypothetical protein